MKKVFLFLAAFLMTSVIEAQTEINIGKMFDVQDEPVDLNDAMTVKNGAVFIGDTRSADKITDGKYRGMRVAKLRRYFKGEGSPVQYQNALSFRRPPQGATKDHKVDVNLVPRSCMIQLKPTSSGKLTICAQTNKPEGNNMYIAVVNGNSFKHLSTLNYRKDDAITGKKDAPFAAKSVNYQYTDGDELWIYSDGSLNLFNIQFSGQFDKNFKGNNPVSLAKAVSRAQK